MATVSFPDIPSFLLKRECGNDGYLRMKGEDANAFLYFIGEPAGEGPIKIGYSAWPVKRLQAIQVSSPVELTILAKVWCLSQWERELHQIFRESRVRGEWFRRTPKLMRVVQAAASRDFGRLVNVLYEDYEATGEDAFLGADQVFVFTEDGDVEERPTTVPKPRKVEMRENLRRASRPGPSLADVWTDPEPDAASE